jgi:hypothetical protein
VFLAGRYWVFGELVEVECDLFGSVSWHCEGGASAGAGAEVGCG